MKALGALLIPTVLLALATVPASASRIPGDPYCMWEPGFAQTVYDATFGIVHLHDGTICTVHLHRPPPPTDEGRWCTWAPWFAELVYEVSLGHLHAHDGAVCYIHPHLE